MRASSYRRSGAGLLSPMRQNGRLSLPPRGIDRYTRPVVPPPVRWGRSGRSESRPCGLIRSGSKERGTTARCFDLAARRSRCRREGGSPLFRPHSPGAPSRGPGSPPNDGSGVRSIARGSPFTPSPRLAPRVLPPCGAPTTPLPTSDALRPGDTGRVRVERSRESALHPPPESTDTTIRIERSHSGVALPAPVVSGSLGGSGSRRSGRRAPHRAPPPVRSCGRDPVRSLWRGSRSLDPGSARCRAARGVAAGVDGEEPARSPAFRCARSVTGSDGWSAGTHPCR